MPESYPAYAERGVGCIGLNEYGWSVPCFEMAWADTDNPVYLFEINEIGRMQLTAYLRGI